MTGSNRGSRGTVFLLPFGIQVKEAKTPSPCFLSSFNSMISQDRFGNYAGDLVQEAVLPCEDR